MHLGPFCTKLGPFCANLGINSHGPLAVLLGGGAVLHAPWAGLPRPREGLARTLRRFRMHLSTFCMHLKVRYHHLLTGCAHLGRGCHDRAWGWGKLTHRLRGRVFQLSASREKVLDGLAVGSCSVVPRIDPCRFGKSNKPTVCPKIKRRKMISFTVRSFYMD